MSDERGVEPLFPRTLFQGHGAPEFRFSDTKASPSEGLDSDWRFTRLQ
jgi:hypothetical protein